LNKSLSVEEQTVENNVFNGEELRGKLHGKETNTSIQQFTLAPLLTQAQGDREDREAHEQSEQ